MSSITISDTLPHHSGSTEICPCQEISVSGYDRQPYLLVRSVRLILLITLPALLVLSVRLMSYKVLMAITHNVFSLIIWRSTNFRSIDQYFTSE